MTAIMLVLIWTSAPNATTVTTPALYFESLSTCEATIPAIEAQVKQLNPEANVSAKCYEEANDPRG